MLDDGDELFDIGRDTAAHPQQEERAHRRRGRERTEREPELDSQQEVVAQRGRQVCVLASGDPYLYGVGSLLARHVDAAETIVVPAPSAFS